MFDAEDCIILYQTITQSRWKINLDNRTLIDPKGL